MVRLECGRRKASLRLGSPEGFQPLSLIAGRVLVQKATVFNVWLRVVTVSDSGGAGAWEARLTSATS